MATTIGSLDLNAFNDLHSDLTQYFWFEPNASATYGAGAHVTLVPDTSFISNPTGQNILMNTEGFSIRNGLLPMMTLDNDSLDFNVVDTTAGTYVATATFTSTGAQIGQSNKTHVNVYSNSLELTDSVGATFFKIRDAVNESGEVTDTFVGDGETTQFTLSYAASNTTYTVTQNGTTVSPTKTTTKITFSTAPAVGDIIVVVYNVVGNSAKAYDLGIRGTNTISGLYSVIEGFNTTASGDYSHAEGHLTKASGLCSHAEGYKTTASTYAHAEGHLTIASAVESHAEGYLTKASGSCSHAEGERTIASAVDSHAEGYRTEASGLRNGYSHAQNEGTIAATDAQTAIGTYNIADDWADDVGTDYGGAMHPYKYMQDGTYAQEYGHYAVIIGNGNGVPIYRDGNSTLCTSNALTVDWTGNVQMYLDLGSNVYATQSIPTGLATSGLDKDLFNAIYNLGWVSDVIV